MSAPQHETAGDQFGRMDATISGKYVPKALGGRGVSVARHKIYPECLFFLIGRNWWFFKRQHVIHAHAKINPNALIQS
jgi:hypothetical protein